MSTQPIELLEQRLTHFGADPELTVLLDERELNKLSMYAVELSAVQIELPARIETSAQLTDVNNLLQRASVAHKGLEEVRRARLKPLEVETKSINDLFRPLTANLSALIDKGKGLVIRWTEAERERVRREREEAQRKADDAARAQAEADERAAKARTEPQRQKALTEFQAQGQAVEKAQAEADAIRNAPRGVRTDEGSTGVRYEWTVEVVNADLVPRKYCVVDLVKLRAAVSKLGEREIPGCSITQRPIASVRTARS